MITDADHLNPNNNFDLWPLLSKSMKMYGSPVVTTVYQYIAQGVAVLVSSLQKVAAKA